MLVALRIISILCWKNWITQRHRPVLWLIEVVVLLFGVLFFALPRQHLQDNQPSNFVDFEPIRLDSIASVFRDRSDVHLNLPKKSDLKLKERIRQSLNLQSETEDNQPSQAVTVKIEGQKMYIDVPQISSSGCLNTGSWKYGEYFVRPPDLFPRCVAKSPQEVPALSKGAEPNYIQAGYLAVQWATYCARLDENNCFERMQNFSVNMISFERYPPSRTDTTSKYASTHLYSYLGFILMAIYFMPTISLIYSISYEKQHGIHEYLRVNGVLVTWQRLAWFLTSLAESALITAIVAAFIFAGTSGKTVAFGTVSVYLLTVFLMGYLLATLSFSLLVSALIHSASAASAFGILLFVLQLLPILFLKMEITQVSLGTLAMLLTMPNAALAIGCWIAVSFECAGRVLSPATIFEGMTVWKSGMSFAWPCAALFLDAAIFALLAWFIEGPAIRRRLHEWWESHESDDSSASHDSLAQPMARLHAVAKSYGSTLVLAGVNLKAYKNQITVIVGHNAAGKTTVMKLLAGREQPTCGRVLVNSMKVQSSTQRARIGYCPQETQLYPLLTVEEHLLLFAKVRSAFGLSQTDAVMNALENFKLKNRRDEIVSHLSAGTQRLVALAVAVIGQPKLVVLDEPTLNMDDETRCQIWTLLKELKQKDDVALVVSTNRMDEADALADRVVVMANGTVQTAGSLHSLRQRFSPGYRLFVVLARSVVPFSEFCWSEVEETLRFYLPNLADDQRMRTAEQRFYFVPNDALAWLPDLMRKLEDLQQADKIANFGTMLTKMEDIFMTVSHYGSQYDPLLTARFSAAVSMQTKGTNLVCTARHLDAQSEVSIPTEFLHLRYHSEPVKFLLRFYMTVLMRLRFTTRYLTITGMQLMAPLGIAAFFVLVPYLFGSRHTASTQLTVAQFAPSTVYYAHQRNVSTATLFLDAAYRSWQTLANHSPVTFTALRENEQSISSVETMRKFLKEHRREVFDTSFISFAFEGTQSLNVTVFFNDVSFHAAPIAMNLLLNTLERLQGIQVPHEHYLLFNPLITDGEQHIPTGRQPVVIALLFALVCFLCAPMVHVVQDSSTQLRLQQQLAGVSRLHYWLIALMYDFSQYVLMLFTILAVLYITEQLMSFAVAFEILLLYGLAILALNYLFSLCFRFGSAAYVCTLLCNMALAIVGTCMFTIQDKLFDGSVSWLLASLSPTVCATFALMRLPTDEAASDSTTVDQFEHLGPIFGILLVQFIVFFTLLQLIDCHVIRKLYYSLMRARHAKLEGSPTAYVVGMEWRQSEDVENERRYIDTNFSRLRNGDYLILRNLTKRYRLVTMTPLAALDRASALIKRGSIFTVLGASGSGKSTLLNMLIGSVPISKGDCYFNGVSVRQHPGTCRKLMSYCPQSNVLLRYVTGLELLVYYSSMRGIVRVDAEKLAWFYIDLLLLRDHAHRLIRHYSGGTRRRLQLAVAFIGHSEYLLLDDPTVQIDAFTRRHVWDVLQKYCATVNCTLVLCTSAVDECMRLSGTLMLLSNGKVMDLGSVVHLNEKHANSYNIELFFKPTRHGTDLSGSLPKSEGDAETSTCSSPPQTIDESKLGDYDREDVLRFIEAFLPGIELISARNNCVHCLLSRRLKDGRILKLSELFQRLTTLQNRFKLVQCGVMQSSIEIIYRNLVKEQRGHFDMERMTNFAELQSLICGTFHKLCAFE